MTGTGTYLYAIVRSSAEVELHELRGVADRPVRVVAADELAALVSTVDLDEFGEEALRANLENLAWLERTARQHDDVIRQSSRWTTTVPLRFATICADDAGARERLQALGVQALEMLARLDGREEWGVKLFALDQPDSQADQVPEPVGASSGAAYLRRRKLELTGRADRAAKAFADADEFFDHLAGRAIAAHRHHPQDQRLSGVPAPMVLNAAFLVDRARADDFQASVTELAAVRPPGAVALTGPWPPYSFATLDQP